jgi:hypothetical protein
LNSEIRIGNDFSKGNKRQVLNAKYQVRQASPARIVNGEVTTQALPCFSVVKK